MATRRSLYGVAVYLAQLLLLAAVYLGVGRLGLAWAIPPGHATLVWPASGVALAAVLVLGYRAGPAIWLGHALTNSLVFYAGGGLAAAAGAVPTAAGIGLGGTVEALAGAFLLRRLAAGRRALDRARGVVAFAALAGLLACAESATAGPAALALGGAIPWAAYGTHWWTWWLGDTAGVLLVTPALLAWANEPRVRWRPRRAAEALVLALLLLGAGLVVFGVEYRAVYLVVPLLVWAAFRFGHRGATTALLAVAGTAIWRTAQGGGPFAGATLQESLLQLQLFLGVAALTTLLLTAVLAERARLHAECEAAVRAREEFLTVAAHELRTPVTSLQGYAQLLLRQSEKAGDPDPAKVRRALQAFDQQSHKLARLVNQLLDLSRLQAGRLVLEPQATDVTALVEGAAAAARATSGQPLVVRAAAPVRAAVDPLRLEQVLLNLIDNALKYGQGEGPVEVEVAQPAPGAVRLAVRDRGPGIPPEHRQRIFERFYQAPGAGQVGGLGLGLHISRQIVELHGGRIDAEWPPEGGTRFVVTLPAGGAAGAGEPPGREAA